MSNLSLVEAKLPPGFRFHPRDEELICDYLMKKVASPHHVYPLMIEVDLNTCEPWDIPETACVGGKEWYFYSLRDRKYATGVRTNRATMCGYWKATGKDRPVIQKGTLVGMRKTLVFYQGRAPKGRKSEWVMHEFRLEGALVPPKTSSIKVDWVLCRMFYKNRDITHKQGVDDTNPSSLPPLMNPFDNITFNNHQALYEQVPCFSIFNRKTLAQMGANPNLSSNLNPLKSYEEKFIDDVLDHFGTVEHNGSSASFGEGSSLSDVGCLPTYVWNY